jgi:hypothetical protein
MPEDSVFFICLTNWDEIAVSSAGTLLTTILGSVEEDYGALSVLSSLL